jgi:hypothetical protein
VWDVSGAVLVRAGQDAVGAGSGWLRSPAMLARVVEQRVSGRLASRQVNIADSAVAPFDGLIHPVHRCGRIFGWRVQPLNE